jgi:hypothetical protein
MRTSAPENPLPPTTVPAGRVAAGVYAAIRDGDFAPAWHVLAEYGVDCSVIRRGAQWISDDRARGSVSQESCSDACAEIRNAASTLAHDPALHGLLLLCVRAEVMEAWEISYDLTRLQTLIETVRGGVPRGDDSLAVIRAIDCLLAITSAELEEERALLTGQRSLHAAAADRAAQFADETARLAGAIEGGPLADYLIAQARGLGEYHRAVGEAVRGLDGYLANGRVPQAALRALDAAIASDAITGDGMRSELRAHRVALAALEGRAGEALRIGQASVAYLYPFALRGIEIGELFDAVRGGGPMALAGAPVRGVAAMDLDDVWNGADEHAWAYAGIVITLDDVVIQLDEGAQERVAVEVRLSTFGNHYVRISRARLTDLTCGDYRTALFRAAPEHGPLQLFHDLGAALQKIDGCERLADYAMEVVRDLRAFLSAAADGDIQCVARRGMFQVVSTISEFTTPFPAGGQPEPADALHDLLAKHGAQVLTNPVPYNVASIADWTRLVVNHDLCRVATLGQGRLIVRSPNTTTLVSIGIPDWVTATQASMAEFAASLDGLFAGWTFELSRHFDEIRRAQDRFAELSGVARPQLKDLERLAHSLEDARHRLSEFMVEAKRTINALRSRSLLSSAVAAEELRLMLAYSDFDQRIEEIEIKTNELAHDRVASAIGRARLRRDERARAKMEVFLAVIAATGLSGLVQVLQAGFSGQNVRWQEGAEISVGAILVIGFTCGIYLWTSRRGSAD